jgi:hypothetical protein
VVVVVVLVEGVVALFFRMVGIFLAGLIVNSMFAFRSHTICSLAIALAFHSCLCSIRSYGSFASPTDFYSGWGCWNRF